MNAKKYALVHICTRVMCLLMCFIFVQSRPFGVSLLIAGHDENGPSL